MVADSVEKSHWKPKAHPCCRLLPCRAAAVNVSMLLWFAYCLATEAWGYAVRVLDEDGDGSVSSAEVRSFLASKVGTPLARVVVWVVTLGGLVGAGKGKKSAAGGPVKASSGRAVVEGQGGQPLGEERGRGEGSGSGQEAIRRVMEDGVRVGVPGQRPKSLPELLEPRPLRAPPGQGAEEAAGAGPNTLGNERHQQPLRQQAEQHGLRSGAGGEAHSAEASAGSGGRTASGRAVPDAAAASATDGGHMGANVITAAEARQGVGRGHVPVSHGSAAQGGGRPGSRDVGDGAIMGGADGGGLGLLPPGAVPEGAAGTGEEGSRRSSGGEGSGSGRVSGGLRTTAMLDGGVGERRGSAGGGGVDGGASGNGGGMSTSS